MDKTDNLRVNSDTPWAKQHRAGQWRRALWEVWAYYPNSLGLRSLCKPWQGAQSEVLTHSSLRNCGCSLSSGHLLVEERKRKKTGTGGGKQKWQEAASMRVCECQLWQWFLWGRQLSRNWMEATTSFHRGHWTAVRRQQPSYVSDLV